MKNKLVLGCFLIVSVFPTFGQTTDKIIKVNKDTLNVNVLNVTDNSISFSYPNETVTTTINRKNVKQIVYKSGRIENISEPIIVNGETDYLKVIITKDPNEIVGLVKIGDVSGKAMKAFGNENKLRITAIDDLKKETAKKRAFIVLIQTDNFSYQPLNNVLITGVAYGY